MKLLYRRVVSQLPARIRIPFLHWKATGHWPRLNPPRTFNEKLCWRKIFLQENAALQKSLVGTADKVSVRDYVSAKIGPEFLTRDFYNAPQSRTLPFDSLPGRFVVKANHGCSWNHFVKDKWAEDMSALHERCDQWLTQTWGGFAGEWWYAMIKPQVLAEEYLEDAAGNPPSDYKFFVMRGDVKMVQVDFDRFVQHKHNLYFPDWRRIECSLQFPTGRDLPKPENFDEMLEVASTLGTDFDFVRVDLYSLGKRIVVGELTHCPGSGWEKFSDPKIDLWLGQQMQLW